MCTRNSLVAFVLVVGLETVGWSCHRPSASVAPAQPPAAAPAAAPAAGAPSSADKSVVAVQVTEEGFVPSRILAEVGKPITLAITRKTDKTCAREILFKDQPGKTDLPLDKQVKVTYTPKTAGTVAFGCAMGMMVGGTLEVH